MSPPAVRGANHSYLHWGTWKNPFNPAQTIGEPNNREAKAEYCAAADWLEAYNRTASVPGFSGTVMPWGWNDQDCNREHAFICKYLPGGWRRPRLKWHAVQGAARWRAATLRWRNALTGANLRAVAAPNEYTVGFGDNVYTLNTTMADQYTHQLNCKSKGGHLVAWEVSQQALPGPAGRHAVQQHARAALLGTVSAPPSATWASCFAPTPPCPAVRRGAELR